MSNIRIDIASEFKDRGFKQADKATTGLNAQLKTLGKTLAATFSTRAIYQFSKASVQAFSEDQQAAARLTKTLDNLGLAFENVRVSSFISDLEAASGVLDDSLRPAMQSLLMTTGSVTKSQELLNLALEMSRASGIDVAVVSRDLSKAYVGQTRSLSKYGIGLAQSELRAKSFAELQALLTEQFTGQNAAYLETYAGKVGVLNVAYANMQETIGEGLVDAFQILSGESGIAGGTKAMDVFAESIANVTRGVATLVEGFSSFSNFGQTVSGFFKAFVKEGNLFDAIQQLGKKAKPLFFPTGGMGSTAEDKARAKAEAAAAKRAKELAALQKKNAAAAAKAEKDRLRREREAQALKRAGTVFDMENIQIVAAMQAKVTDDQRLRLTALLALNTGNAEAAEKLSTLVLASNAPALANLGVLIKSGDTVDTVIKKLLESQSRVALLGMGIADIPKAKNPFEDWPSIIASLLSQINSLKSSISSFGSGSTGGAATGSTGSGSKGNSGVGGTTVTVPSAITPPAGVNENTNLGGGFNIGINQYPNSSYFAGVAATSPYMSSSYFAGLAAVEEARRDQEIRSQSGSYMSSSYFAGAAAVGATVIVNVNGSVTTEGDLADKISNVLLDRQKSGGSGTFSARIL